VALTRPPDSFAGQLMDKSGPGHWSSLVFSASHSPSQYLTSRRSSLLLLAIDVAGFSFAPFISQSPDLRCCVRPEEA
jgi:hypothetical protein